MREVGIQPLRFIAQLTGPQNAHASFSLSPAWLAAESRAPGLCLAARAPLRLPRGGRAPGSRLRRCGRLQPGGPAPVGHAGHGLWDGASPEGEGPSAACAAPGPVSRTQQAYSGRDTTDQRVKQRTFVFSALDAGRLRPAPCGRAIGRALFPACGRPPSCYALTWWRQRAPGLPPSGCSSHSGALLS